jgi:hypothetical protein
VVQQVSTTLPRDFSNMTGGGLDLNVGPRIYLMVEKRVAARNLPVSLDRLSTRRRLFCKDHSC